MLKQKILIFHPTIHPSGLQLLSEHFEIMRCPSHDEGTIIQLVNEHNIQAIVTRVEKITQNIFEQCPSLKIISQHGVGVDHIDVDAATKYGVCVLNVPDSNFTSVVEHTLMSILSLSRNLIQSDGEVRKRNWNYREEFFPVELTLKTLFIVGFGMIGRELARKASIFNMHIIAFDPAVSKLEMEALGVHKVDHLHEGLQEADFVTLHVPLTTNTKHLISTDEFKRMKESAFLVNVARGPVVDEKALYSAIVNKEISGAALDVLEEEPPVSENLLFQLNNVIFTPHMAGDTLEAKIRCATFLANDLIKTLIHGHHPKNLLNTFVIKNARLYKND